MNSELTTVDIANADAAGYRSGRESLVPLISDLVAALERAMGGIGNAEQFDAAADLVAQAKHVIATCGGGK